MGNPCPDMLGVGEVVPMYWGQGSRGGEPLGNCGEVTVGLAVAETALML